MTIQKTALLFCMIALALSGCGGKKEKPAVEPVPTPAKPAAEAPAAKQVDSSSADALFDEFFDSSTTAEIGAIAEKDGAEKPTSKAEQGTASAKSKIKSKPNPDGRYVIQVSCVASEELAERIAKKLEKTGFPVYVAEVQNPTPQLMGTYYRIRIGGFADRESAKAFGESQLAPNGFSFWVDARANDNVGANESASTETASSQGNSDAKEPTSGSKEEAW